MGRAGHPPHSGALPSSGCGFQYHSRHLHHLLHSQLDGKPRVGCALVCDQTSKRCLITSAHIPLARTQSHDHAALWGWLCAGQKGRAGGWRGVWAWDVSAAPPESVCSVPSLPGHMPSSGSTPGSWSVIPYMAGFSRLLAALSSQAWPLHRYWLCYNSGTVLGEKNGRRTSTEALLHLIILLHAGHETVTNGIY